MWTGRTRAQKRALVRAITEAMVQHAAAKPDNLHVILQEVPKENWALAGVLGDERKESVTISPDTTPRATEFAHMLLKVSDIKRSERFYVDLLGLKVRPAKPLADGRPFVPFTQGLALTVGGPDEPLQIEHIAFKVHDVAGIAERLRKADAKFYQDLHQGIYGLTIYVADPDGNRIELFEEGALMP
jgi:4-oxalocrotonate tautomerase family enzyme